MSELRGSQAQRHAKPQTRRPGRAQRPPPAPPSGPLAVWPAWPARWLASRLAHAPGLWLGSLPSSPAGCVRCGAREWACGERELRHHQQGRGGRLNAWRGGVALEKLDGVRDRARRNWYQWAALSAGPSHQVSTASTYKARRVGVQTVTMDDEGLARLAPPAASDWSGYASASPSAVRGCPLQTHRCRPTTRSWTARAAMAHSRLVRPPHSPPGGPGSSRAVRRRKRSAARCGCRAER